jgi:hypothetical protein
VAGELSVLAAIFKSVPDVARNRRTWTDDQLATAVYNAQSWRGVLRNLGLYQNGPIHVVRREAQRLGLDTSHFGSGVRWTDARLTAALDEAASWPQLLSAIGKVTLSLRAYRDFVVGDASSLLDSLDPTLGSGASPLRPAS